MTAKDPEQLSLDVATVWRYERVSCPHPDILKAYLAGGLDDGAAGFLEFHLGESRCPYCNATVEDLKLCDEEAADSGFSDLRDRLLRSTVTALRDPSGSD